MKDTVGTPTNCIGVVVVVCVECFLSLSPTLQHPQYLFALPIFPSELPVARPSAWDSDQQFCFLCFITPGFSFNLFLSFSPSLKFLSLSFCLPLESSLHSFAPLVSHVFPSPRVFLFVSCLVALLFGFYLCYFHSVAL